MRLTDDERNMLEYQCNFAAWQEVDRLRKENERLKHEWHNEHAARNDQLAELTEMRVKQSKLRRENERLKSQLDDAVKILRWYADEHHYTQEYCLHGDDERDGHWESPSVMDDHGERAQQAIQRIKGEGTE